MRISRIAFAALLLQAVSIRTSGADSWAAATETNVQSSNGAYRARLVPGDSWGDTYGFAGAAKGEYARAIVDGPGADDEVSFTLVNPIAPVDAIVLDDGSLVTFDNWHNLGYGKVAARYDVTGNVQWSHELEDLLPSDWLGNVMYTTSSRHWRKDALEWSLRGTGSATAIVVTLWNEHHLELRLTDGRVRLVEVEDLGGDAERWRRRADDLADRVPASEETDIAAIAAYDKAIELSPELIAAYRGLASVHQRRGEFSRATVVLEAAVLQSPIPSPLPSSRGSWQGDARMHLRMDLARLYERMEYWNQAELVLVESLRLDPGYWSAGEALAKLWLRQHRTREAGLLLARFYLLKRGSRPAAAAFTIGHVYEQMGEDDSAKLYYQKGLGEEYLDESLCRRLAALHEHDGEHERALRVLETLKAYLVRERERMLENTEGNKQLTPEAVAAVYEEKLGEVDEELARLRDR